MNELEALRELHEAVSRLRQTAPVDDDFPDVMAQMKLAHDRASLLLNSGPAKGFNVFRPRRWGVDEIQIDDQEYDTHLILTSRELGHGLERRILYRFFDALVPTQE